MTANYADLCDSLFARLEELLEKDYDHLDYESNGEICEIDAPTGPVIINRQPPIEEIWMAAKSGGYHFRYNGTAWIDTRDGTELFARLAICLA